jgi:hypothetical protein
VCAPSTKSMTTEPSLRLKIPPKQISYFLQLTYALPNPFFRKILGSVEITGYLVPDVRRQVALEVVDGDWLHRRWQHLLPIFFDDGADVPEERRHPEVDIVDSFSSSGDKVVSNFTMVTYSRSNNMNSSKAVLP